MSVEFLSGAAIIAGVCIAAVNVVVEVLKSFWLKKETSIPLAVVAVSEMMSFFVMYMYCEAEKAVFSPMMAVGTFFGGFFVAYGAMFGYDKLYGEFFEKIKKLIGRD